MPDHDYIPGGNAAFNQWQENFTNFTNNFISGFGLTANALAEWQLLTNTAGKKKKRWEAAWAIVRNRNCKKSERVEMHAARKDYERGISTDPTDTGLRPFIARYLRYNKKVTKEQKEAMGLTLPGDFKLPSAEAIAQSDNIDVAGAVSLITHLMHKNSVKTIGSNSRARGKGISEIEVYIAFTPANQKVPPPLKEFEYDGSVHRGIYVRMFSEEQEGMRAWYYARKVIRRKTKIFGQPSVFWSAVIS